jgi:two-component system response regulator AlgR
MKVLVCDDEPLARERLKRMLDKIPGAECIGEAENGVDLLQKVPHLNPEIIISDIRMPGMDGIEAAEHLSRLNEPPALIFCTAYDDYAIKAFQVNAMGYLLKPVKQQDLEQALGQARRLTRAQLASLREETAEPVRKNGHAREFISARTHRGIELIQVTDIRYFMADQKYVTVRHLGGEVLIDETLKDLETEFENVFFRIHRNCLIRLDCLEGIEQTNGQINVRLRGVAEVLPVSRRLMSNLKKVVKSL